MKVKICGITNTDDALLCENLGADALGFIFYKKSKRYINFEDAGNIIKRLSVFTNKVGVFVNEKPDLVNFIAEKLRLTGVQLHGEEPPEYVDVINHQVIKAFRVTESFNYNEINNYENITPLLDTFKDGEYGGTGNIFNWSSIPEEIRNTIIIAGGVSEANIEEIYKSINPMAVDISSSLEEQPGIKDKSRTKAFFNKINKLRSEKWSL